jgi:GNAT superfamily N-acetyltransferase
MSGPAKMALAAMGSFATIGEVNRGFDFQVREATAGDAAGILQCLRAAFAPFRRQYTPRAFRDTVLTEATLRERMKRMKVFVAADEGENVAGTIACAVADGEGHLRGMAVRPKLQGCGVAARLLAAAENELRAAQCLRVTLDTTEPLARAIQFYGRRGYRASGRVRDFFGMRLYEYVKRAVTSDPSQDSLGASK